MVETGVLGRGVTIATTGARADAIVAQSIGGGGGRGGAAFTTLGSLGVVKSANVSVGGNGGVGGKGGTVNVTNNNNLSTKDGGGIFAQSTGGGGGYGGMSASVAAGNDKSLQATTTVGGTGGKAGDAADVTVTNTGNINVRGTEAYGITASSVGGGGGYGGTVLSVALGQGSTLNTGVAVGGSGRDGGAAGAVVLTNSGSISTSGDSAVGIYAQSAGGGGGWGRAAAAVSLSGASSIVGSVAVGGSGGAGSEAKSVTVTQKGGSISTAGDHAYAIYAQSVGGGGGMGGFGMSQALATGSFAGAASVSVGGNGGEGAIAGAVSVDNSASLQTAGAEAYGIYAQSVGGGGGEGYLANATSGLFGSADGASLAIAVGGKGGKAGNGADVTVSSKNGISTTGDGAIGIYAESTGGGGGHGGNAKGAAETFAGGSGGKAGYSASMSASIGGSAGAAGDGASVKVSNGGAISVKGNEAQGIYAESVGGGGGAGGHLVGSWDALLKIYKLYNSYTKGGDALSLSVNIGGKGGASGKGGTVTVDNTGAIETFGINGTAILAQSVGGGGGAGGNGLIGRINVGGDGGASGNGQTVNVTNSATLRTSGNGANGIFAQSVGGGGGIGGATDTIRSTEVLDRSSAAGYLSSISTLFKFKNTDAGISIGGDGGASGNGGGVNVTNSGAISTEGAYANAIKAQSVGGGGGDGGVGVWMKPAQITLPGKGSNSGSGGNVTVNNSGALSTTGDAAMGIFAQSVGGGGGVAGEYAVGLFALADVPGWNFVNGGAFNYSKNAGGIVTSGDNGNGGNITINSTGNITVTGIGSIGILAQTAGGGGGLVGGAGSEFLGTFGNNGSGGNINLTQSGAISATGDNGVGIMLQSVGNLPKPSASLQGASNPNGNITATIGGTVVGGAGLTGTGMVVSGGSTNQITISSTGALSAKSGIAFLSGDGNDTLTNQGKIKGVVDMGGGQNTINNEGLFYAAPRTMLGSATTGYFNNLNGGTFQVGDGKVIQDGTIFGSLVQSDGGTLSVLIHDASTSQTRALAGSTLLVMGSVKLEGGSVRFGLDASGTLPVSGTYDLNILGAGDGIRVTGDITATSPNPLISATLSSQSDRVTAKVTIDYTPDGVKLSSTQATVGDAIAAIANHEKASIHPLLGATRFQQGVSNSNFTPFVIADALDPVELAGSAEQLIDVYQSLSPAAYAAAQAAQLYAAVGFNDTLLADGSAASHRIANDNGGVAWLDFTGRRYSADFAPTRFSESGFGPSAGVSMELPSGWKVGAGVGYQSIADHMSDFASGSGFRLMAGLTAEHDLGPVDGEIALSAGAQNLRTDRRVHAFDGSLYTTAKQTSAFGTATFRLSHEFDFGDWQVRPMIDASVVVLGMPGVTEAGAGPLDLDVYGDTTTSFRIGPAVDIKGKTSLFGQAIEPRLKVGFSDWVAGGNPAVRADFVGLAGIPDMVSAQPGAGITADVTAGVGMDTGEGIDLRVFYTGHLNGETQIHAINFQAGYHF
jgi:hypothetical protein